MTGRADHRLPSTAGRHDPAAPGHRHRELPARRSPQAGSGREAGPKEIAMGTRATGAFEIGHDEQGAVFVLAYDFG